MAHDITPAVCEQFDDSLIPLSDGLPDDFEAEMDAAFGYDLEPTDEEIEAMYQADLERRRQENLNALMGIGSAVQLG